MIQTFTQPYQLWRYDVSEPPDKWDANYRSIEYTYPDAMESLRYKNKISAAYFYDDKLQAFLTGMTAAKNQRQDNFWLTSACLMPTVNLLDLRFHHQKTEKVPHMTPLMIINRLSHIGIDVLTDEYLRYDGINGNVTSLSYIKSTFEEIRVLDALRHKTESQSSKIIILANEFNAFFHNKIGYVGQLLTDFNNGHKFKAALQTRNIDGYIFEEEEHMHKPTFCIFDYGNLSAPHRELAHI